MKSSLYIAINHDAILIYLSGPGALCTGDEVAEEDSDDVLVAETRSVV